MYKIYCYTNQITNQKYIGCTKLRLQCERSGKNGHNYKNGTPFREAIDNYGWNNFKYEILEDNLTKEDSELRERYYIEKLGTLYPNGYNLQSGGWKDRKMHEVTKQKTSQTLTETWKDEELKKHQSQVLKGKNIWSKGRKLSEETKRKISENNPKPFLEKHHTEESRKKMSEARKGKPGNITTLGKKCFNDGVTNVYAHDCPEGFVPGRLVKQKCQNTT